MENLIVGPEGQGLFTRPGRLALNTTAFGSSTDPVIGVGTGISSGTEYVVAIRSAKFFTKSIPSGLAGTSFTDSTGAYAGLTTGTYSGTWDLFQFNDVIVGFGNGQAPISWGFSGNVAALAGSPPSAYGGFTANNRVFAYRTTANPSTLYWSALGDQTDWSGAGAGETEVGTAGEGSPLIAVVPLKQDMALAFKKDAIYRIDLTAAPFSQHLLFDGVGLNNKQAVTVVDGIAYFLTPTLEMKATDGNTIMDFPTGASNEFTVSTYSPANPFAVRLRGGFTASYSQQIPQFDWVGFIYNNSTIASSRAIFWDRLNKCWIKCTNFPFNCFATTSAGVVLAGHHNAGYVSAPMFSGSYGDLGGTAKYVDEDGSSTTAITGTWTSGWMALGTTAEMNRLTQMTVNAAVKANYTMTVTYDYDYASALNRSASFSFSIGSGGAGHVTKRAFITGRGNVFRYKLTLSPTASTQTLAVHSLLLAGKSSGKRVLAA